MDWYCENKCINSRLHIRFIIATCFVWCPLLYVVDGRWSLLFCGLNVVSTIIVFVWSWLVFLCVFVLYLNIGILLFVYCLYLLYYRVRRHIWCRPWRVHWSNNEVWCRVLLGLLRIIYNFSRNQESSCYHVIYLCLF